MFLLIIKATIAYIAVLAIVDMARKCHSDMNSAITPDTISLLHPGMKLFKVYDIDNFMEMVTSTAAGYPYREPASYIGDGMWLPVIENTGMGAFEDNISLSDAGVTSVPYNRHKLFISEDAAKEHLAMILERGPIPREVEIFDPFEALLDITKYDGEYWPDSYGDCQCSICKP